MITAIFLGLIGQVATLDVRIEGEGYLRFANDGRIVYAKSASLTVKDGRLTTAAGASLMPMVTAPQGTSKLGAEKDGRLYAIIGKERKDLGRITFAMFGAAESLAKQGDYFVAKNRPSLEYPGENGAGTLIAPHPTEANQAIKPNKPTTTIDSAGFQEFTIPASIELDGGHMTLDRIIQNAPESAKSKLQSADFGPIPSPGFPTRITRQRIQAKLLLAGFKDSQFHLSMSDVVEISSVGQRIEPKQFIEAALAGVTAKLGVALELKVEGEILGFTVPKGKLELKTESVTQRENQIQAIVAMVVDGRRINSKVINFTGEQAAITIKAGELVKVVMRANGVSIDTTGRAKRAGRLGDQIEVEVTLTDSNSKTSHLGIVKGPGLVEVKL